MFNYKSFSTYFRPCCLGSKVGWNKSIHSYKKNNDDRRADLRAAQKDVAEKILLKESEANGKKRKQALMDELLQPTKKIFYIFLDSVS